MVSDPQPLNPDFARIRAEAGIGASAMAYVFTPDRTGNCEAVHSRGMEHILLTAGSLADANII
jgi:hypothetical protein